MYKKTKGHWTTSTDLRSFNPDCALFDVDGVLVDIRNSYDVAIKKTVDFILEHITGRPTLHGLVTDKLILKLRQTGGFNNDIDASYAIILATLANLQKNLHQARRFLFTVIKNIDEGGINSVENFLSSYPSPCHIESLKELLVYPESVGKSMLATVFDELFYGPQLFKQYHRLEPKYYFGKPLIKNDKIIATKRTMDLLSEKFKGNLAIVSGRSRLAAEYSLKSILDTFNQKACVFLEDEKREYAKPNPYSIERAMKTMNCRSAIYAADSIEDLLMAQRAEKEMSFKIAFFGIYGYTAQPRQTMHQLRKNGAAGIIRSINLLPNILNKVLTDV